MITVKKDRSVYIPECDRHIGFENDNMVSQRIFEICDKDLFGFSFKLDLKNTLDIVDLAPCGETENSRLYAWNITSAAIGAGGVITAQIRAFNESGDKVWHSAWIEFVSEPSVNAEKQINDERVLSEYEQLEVRVSNAVTLAENSVSSAEASAKKAASDAKNAAESATSAGAYYSLAVTCRELAEADAVSANSSKESAAQSASDSYNYSMASSQAAEIASGYVNKAKEYAENASESCEEAQAAAQAAKETETRLNEITGGYEALVNTLGEHFGNTDNPHGVTASQVGAYTKSEADTILGGKADKADTYGSFVWTDFEHTVSDPLEDGISATVSADVIDFPDLGESITIHCAGETLGFTFKASGYGMATITVNGSTRQWQDTSASGGEIISFAFPLTYMESDIIISGDYVKWEFSEMKIIKARGLSSVDKGLIDHISAKSNPHKVTAPQVGAYTKDEIDEMLGDTSTALDSILAIEESLIGGETA